MKNVTSKVGALEGTRHTLDVFDSLRVANVVSWSSMNDEPSSAYDVNDYNEVGFLAGGAARIFFDREEAMPMAGPTAHAPPRLPNRGRCARLHELRHRQGLG